MSVTDAAQDHTRHTDARRSHWSGVAGSFEKFGANRYYHRRLRDIYAAHVPSGQRVLELGCGTGELLAAVQPSHGIGIDFSPVMVAEAQARHPHLSFHAHDLSALEGRFDVVILSDLLNDLWDAQEVLSRVAKVSHAGTRVVLNNYSRRWEQPLSAAASLGTGPAARRRGVRTVAHGDAVRRAAASSCD